MITYNYINQKNSLDIVNVVNDYSSWKPDFLWNIHIGVQKPISSNHHSCVLTVYYLENRVKRLIDH